MTQDQGKQMIVMIFGLIGCIFIAVGVLLYKVDSKYKKYGIETTAVIEEISSHIGHKNRREHDVIVSYYAGDQHYEEELGYYSSSMRIGDEVTIYYLPDNPRKISKKGGIMLLTIIFSSIGGLMAIVAVLVHVYLDPSKIVVSNKTFR